MNVLMTADAVGGVWAYALDLSRALRAEGISSAVATMGPLPSRPQRAAACEAGVELFESSYRLEWMDDPWEDVERAGDWLLELAERMNADLVHLNGYAHAALPWRVPTLVVAHSCVLSWWEAVHHAPAPERYARYRKLVRAGLNAAGQVVAPTRAMLEALDRHYGPIRGGLVIPNGRQRSGFDPRPKESFLFAAGRLWDEAKGIGALLDVADRLQWPVLIAGDAAHPSGTPAPNGASYPRSDRAPASPRFLGPLDPAAMEDWLGRAAIFTSPALYEPFGLLVLEAALCGCTLVLNDLLSLRENWEDCALFVRARDASAYADSLHAVIDDVDRRTELGRAARERALQLDADGMARAYAGVYRRLRLRAARDDAEVSCAS